MEKVIYENESSKLVAKVDGGIVELTQYINGEMVGSIAMYQEEAKELTDFISGLDEES